MANADITSGMTEHQRQQFATHRFFRVSEYGGHCGDCKLTVTIFQGDLSFHNENHGDTAGPLFECPKSMQW